VKKAAMDGGKTDAKEREAGGTIFCNSSRYSVVGQPGGGGKAGTEKVLGRGEG